MNVDRMRAIDYYLGKPLCWLFTVLLTPVWWLARPANASPKKVLLIELSEMGSAILVDPAMRQLQRQGCDIYFAIFAKNKVSLKLLGTVTESHIFCLRETSLLLLVWDTLRLLVWCRRQRIDAVIDLELFSRFTALLTGLSGASKRVGFYRFHNEGLYRGEMLTHKVAYNPHIHISRNFLSQVEALCSNTLETPLTKKHLPLPTLAKRPRNEAHIAALKQQIELLLPVMPSTQLVLINANASDLLPQRRWPRQHFVELIRLLLAQEEQVCVLLTGSPTEKPGLDELAAQVGNPRCVNFAGAIEFMMLPSLYELASVMVSNDSGPPHFASVTSLSTIVLFGPESPDLYSSLGDTTAIYAGLNCSPCVSAWNHRKTACQDNLCLQVISPQQVLEQLTASLHPPQVTQTIVTG